ncbi:hypothetical protein D5266_06550, partial [bacterium c-19]|nr:hypothetical protein [bacterium c-19]
MWKKAAISVFALIIIAITSAYGYSFYQMNAAGSYAVSSNSTGRIGHLKQGDRIYMGTKYNGINLEMQLLKSNPNSDGNNVWLTMSKHFENAVTPYTYNDSEWTNFTHNYSKSLLKNYYATLNNNIVSGSKDEAMIVERTPYTTLEQNSNVIALDYLQPYMAENRFWCLTMPETQFNADGMSYQLINSQEVYLLKYDRDYWAGNGSVSKPNWISFIGATGAAAIQNVQTKQLALRASAKLNLDDVVFALSTGTGSNYTASITNPVANTTNIWNTAGDPMKIRLLNPDAMNVDFNDIKNANNDSVQKVMKGSVVKIHYDNATVGNTNTISLLLSDTSGSELKYYEPLESAASSGIISFDTGNIPIGKYQAYLVNEEYTTDAAPVYSSPLSNAIPFEITKHKISYTKQPQSGASSGKDYEFSKNVNAGQIIGNISVNPQGVMPLTYAMESNGDNSYQNFEIDGLNSSSASSSTTLKVKIKNNAPDLLNGGLKAGTYKFCVSAKDANGDPATTTADTKVCTSFTVEKTDLSVAFNDPAQTKKSMTDAATAWSETATANPSTGTKITYSKSGGYSALIEIDPDTGEITYNGNNAFNKVTIRATADDDPSTGLDNYNPAYVEKEIVIYRGVNATLTPDSASSDTSVPTFTASQTNVMENGVIGTITGNEGTPDMIGGSTTTYSYELVNGQDSGMFQITTSGNVGTIKVKAGSQLGVGSYHFVIKVSDKWSSKDIAVTVNVGVAGAENLQFYETSAAINMITSKSVKVTDTNVAVFACVKGSTNTNPVKYKIKDGSTNVIEINENSGAVTIHGVGTVTIVAEKQGAAGQADAYAELTFTVTAGAQNFIYTDNAGNELPKSGSNYSAKKEVYDPNKTFQLYTAGNPTGSSVTYQLKAGSPTDVISIDASGLVTILNASQNSQMGKVIVQATSHDPSGNYSDKTIELPINIDKGTRVITFAEDPIYVVNGSGSVTPVIEVDGV